jgi:pimeloyl-ACP methyl ester carboxylesterase
MPLLAQDHRVVAVDLKGYGYSQRDPATDLSRTGQTWMLRALIATLGIERATFVGHSMGGGIVQRLAAMHPDAVEALVLVASVTEDDRFGRRARGRIPALPARLLRPFLPALASFAANRLLKLSYYDPSLLTDEVRDGYLRPARIRGSMDGLMAMFRASAHEEPPDLSRVVQPVLLLNGAHDRVVPLSAAQHLRERLPQARLTVVDRAAHLLMEERADECAAAIRAFVADARAQGQIPLQVARPA